MAILTRLQTLLATSLQARRCNAGDWWIEMHGFRASALFVARRVVVLIPQLLAVAFVAFILIRLLPGDPAVALLGPNHNPEAIAALDKRLGLDKPLVEQFWIYLQSLVHGNMGRSWFTGQPVVQDLIDRAPATLELLFYTMAIAVIVGVALGATLAIKGNKGVVARGVQLYARLSGSFPDFWLALVAVYVFFYLLAWVPAPLGRLGVRTDPPPRITGFFTVDAIVTGNMPVFWDAASHLLLPCLVLGLVLAPAIAKITSASMSTVLYSDFIRYERISGLKSKAIVSHTLRNAAAPIVTSAAVLFVYLLGGAVLIEKIFSWGGLGQYAVDSVINADYFALQGFVLAAALYTVGVYFIVDVIHMLLDPRVR